MNNIEIATFNALELACLFLEAKLDKKEYNKGEILKTEDGRYRVSVFEDRNQLELFKDG